MRCVVCVAVCWLLFGLCTAWSSTAAAADPQPLQDPDQLQELPEVGDDVDPYLKFPAPRPPGEVIQLAVGNDRVCALLTNGLTLCWSYRAADVLMLSRPMASIAAGRDLFCGLDTTSRVHCWGPAATAFDPPTDPMIAVDAGDGYACGLDAAGEPMCWGRLDAAHRNLPRGPFQALAADGSRTCASGVWDAARCWGRPTKPAEPFDEQVRQLDVGSDAVCALDVSNRPICEFAPAARAFEPPSPAAVDLAVGDRFVCTLEHSGSIECAGPQSPRLPPSPPISRKLDASGDILCAVTAWESIQCWDSTGEILAD